MEIKFPQDVENFIDDLCARAIIRAIKNGTYKGVNPDVETRNGLGPAEREGSDYRSDDKSESCSNVATADEKYIRGEKL